MGAYRQVGDYPLEVRNFLGIIGGYSQPATARHFGRHSAVGEGGGMDEIRAFFINPYTWVAFGVGAIAGVWWAQMSPTTTNLTLAFGVFALTLAATLHQEIAGQAWGVRALWVLATFSVSSLGVYYTLWARADLLVVVESEIQFLVTTRNLNYPDGTVLAGLDWHKGFVELNVAITNGTDAPYRSLDVFVRPPNAIASISQQTGLPGVTFIPYSGAIPPTYTQGESAVPTELLATDAGYRILADMLPAHTSLRVIAGLATIRDDAVRFEFMNAEREWNNWFRRLNDGLTPADYYGERPEIPDRIEIEATFLLSDGSIKTVLRETIPVTDLGVNNMAGAIIR